MPTKRKRISRNRYADVSPWRIAWLKHGDEPGPSEPGIIVDWYAWHDRKPLWDELRDEILAEWIEENPGTRPYAWWLFDAQEPRRRLGGTGTPIFEVYAHKPTYSYGIPDHWLTEPYVNMGFINGEPLNKPVDHPPVDPDDPPVYESQAAYLDRHGLLTDLERRHADFEPEIACG